MTRHETLLRLKQAAGLLYEVEEGHEHQCLAYWLARHCRSIIESALTVLSAGPERIEIVIPEEQHS